MNLAFYEALDRIPLGIAVTIEFVGPLGVAVAGSRRPLDLAWVVLAAAGILLLSDFGSADLDALGVALALLAGGFWAAYILLSVRVGNAFPGATGLALAMVAATAMLAPVGVADAGARLLVPGVLVAAAAVAILSSAIPYTLEMEALRRMPAGVFGVMMSIEPAVAALAGFIVLDEGLATQGAGRDSARGGRQCRSGTQCSRAAAGRLGLGGPHPCGPGVLRECRGLVLLRVGSVDRADGGPDGEQVVHAERLAAGVAPGNAREAVEVDHVFAMWAEIVGHVQVVG